MPDPSQVLAELLGPKQELQLHQSIGHSSPELLLGEIDSSEGLDHVLPPGFYLGAEGVPPLGSLVSHPEYKLYLPICHGTIPLMLSKSPP